MKNVDKMWISKRRKLHEDEYHAPIFIKKIIHQYSIFEMIEREKKYFNGAGDPLPWETADN